MLALVGAVALVVGVALGAWFAGGPAPIPARSAPAPAAPGSNELAPALAELARALTDLRATLGVTLAPQPTPAHELVPVAATRESTTPVPSARDGAELAAALDRLAASLRALDLGALRGTPGDPGRRLVVPTWVNRTTAFVGSGLRQAVEAGDDMAWERTMDAFRKKHLFWTTQQVLDAYGKPDEIEVGEQHSSWTYRLPIADGDEEVYEFSFSDGLVYSVDYSS